MTGTTLAVRSDLDRQADDLLAYAGFAAAEHLTDAERVVALLSLVPMALQVVEEARDTIERLNDEVATLRATS